MNQRNIMTDIQNPFFAETGTPHQTVPFHLIRTEHYEPAINQAMEEHDREIEAIIHNSPVQNPKKQVINVADNSTDVTN